MKSKFADINLSTDRWVDNCKRIMLNFQSMARVWNYALSSFSLILHWVPRRNVFNPRETSSVPSTWMQDKKEQRIRHTSSSRNRKESIKLRGAGVLDRRRVRNGKNFWGKAFVAASAASYFEQNTITWFPAWIPWMMWNCLWKSVRPSMGGWRLLCHPAASLLF